MCALILRWRGFHDSFNILVMGIYLLLDIVVVDNATESLKQLSGSPDEERNSGFISAEKK